MYGTLKINVRAGLGKRSSFSTGRVAVPTSKKNIIVAPH